jgi:hypothetical protein
LSLGLLRLFLLTLAFARITWVPIACLKKNIRKGNWHFDFRKFTARKHGFQLICMSFYVFIHLSSIITIQHFQVIVIVKFAFRQITKLFIHLLCCYGIIVVGPKSWFLSFWNPYFQHQ